MPESEFPERYQSICREVYGTARIHVNVAWRRPQFIKAGDFVMYLPLEITEQIEGMIPRMARVDKVVHTDDIRIFTNLGVMVFRDGDEVQVVV